MGASSRWAEMRVKWKVSVFPDQAGCTDVPKSRMKGKNISMQGSFASPDERISSFYRLLDAWPGFLRKAAQERSYSHTYTHGGHCVQSCLKFSLGASSRSINVLQRLTSFHRPACLFHPAAPSRLRLISQTLYIYFPHLQHSQLNALGLCVCRYLRG